MGKGVQGMGYLGALNPTFREEFEVKTEVEKLVIREP